MRPSRAYRASGRRRGASRAVSGRLIASGRKRASTGEGGLSTLSRWRHGFESRWGCHDKVQVRGPFLPAQERASFLFGPGSAQLPGVMSDPRRTLTPMRGSIQDRSGPAGPAFRVRISTPSGRVEQTLRWTGPELTSQTARNRAHSQLRAEAERLRTRLLAEVDDGAHSGPDATFGTLLDRWQRLRGPSWSAATRREHGRIAGDTGYLATLRPVRVSKISGEDLDDLYAALLARPLKASTVRRAHVVAHSALAQAVQWGWILRNPADRAHAPRVERTEVKPPSTDDVAALLEHADNTDPHTAAYLWLTATLGARRGEVCALRWSNLDHERRTVRIHRASAKGPEGIVEQDTKTHAGRTCRVTDAAWDRLMVLRDKVAGEGHDVVDGYIFAIERDGAPIYPDTASRVVRKLAKRAGVPDVTIRQLRHAAATHALANGVPLHTVSARLGHARTSMTLDIYGHALDAHDDQAADLLGDLYDAKRHRARANIRAV